MDPTVPEKTVQSESSFSTILDHSGTGRGPASKQYTDFLTCGVSSRQFPTFESANIPTSNCGAVFLSGKRGHVGRWEMTAYGGTAPADWHMCCNVRLSINQKLCLFTGQALRHKLISIPGSDGVAAPNKTNKLFTVSSPRGMGRMEWRSSMGKEYHLRCNG